MSPERRLAQAVEDEIAAAIVRPVEREVMPELAPSENADRIDADLSRTARGSVERLRLIREASIQRYTEIYMRSYGMKRAAAIARAEIKADESLRRVIEICDRTVLEDD